MVDPQAGIADTREQILALTELAMRKHGFHQVSFRDIASAMAIKSASVHYHFPTKIALGVALVARYQAHITQLLGDPAQADVSPAQLLARYIEIFRRQLCNEGAPCLCLVLAAGQAALPSPVQQVSAAYFDVIGQWLNAVIKRHNPQQKKKKRKAQVQAIMAGVAGAALLAQAQNDLTVFERGVSQLHL